MLKIVVVATVSGCRLDHSHRRQVGATARRPDLEYTVGAGLLPRTLGVQVGGQAAHPKLNGVVGRKLLAKLRRRGAGPELVVYGARDGPQVWARCASRKRFPESTRGRTHALRLSCVRGALSVDDPQVGPGTARERAGRRCASKPPARC